MKGGKILLRNRIKLYEGLSSVLRSLLGEGRNAPIARKIIENRDAMPLLKQSN